MNIIFVDECPIKTDTIMNKAFTPKKRHIILRPKKLQSSFLNILAAVSVSNGLETVLTQTKAYNSEDFQKII